MCWTRPDGPLWLLLPCVALLVGLRSRGFVDALRAAFALLQLPVAAVLAQLGFRALYYGDTVPNTAHVKVEWGAQALRAGVAYNVHALTVLGGLVALAAVGVVLAQRPQIGRAHV